MAIRIRLSALAQVNSAPLPSWVLRAMVRRLSAPYQESAMPVTPLDRASAARVAALPSQAVSSQPFAELLHSKQTRIGLNPASVLDALSPAARRAFDAAMRATPTLAGQDVGAQAVSSTPAVLNAALDSLLNPSSPDFTPEAVKTALRQLQASLAAGKAPTTPSETPSA
jgi:hypothetical protein